MMNGRNSKPAKPQPAVGSRKKPILRPAPDIPVRYPKSLPGKTAPAVSDELLTIVIDLGKGREEHIVVRKDDDPAKLAATFCSKYGLGTEQQRKLCERIAQHMDEAMMEESVSNDAPEIEGGSGEPAAAKERRLKTDQERNKEIDEEMADVGDESTGDIGYNCAKLHKTQEICRLKNVINRNSKKSECVEFVAEDPKIRMLCNNAKVVVEMESEGKEFAKKKVRTPNYIWGSENTKKQGLDANSPERTVLVPPCDRKR